VGCAKENTMAGSLNKVMIIGHLGRDPELRYTQTGTPVATLNIATSEGFTDRSGNKTERTEWHRVVVWERQAETCNTYLKKGSLVYVEGSLQTRQWQDQQGQTRYTTEIKAQRVQFLDTRRGQQGQYPDDGYQGPPDEHQPPQQQGGQGVPSQGQGGAPQSSDAGPRNQEPIGPAFPSEIDQMPF
jgi:single-strand DNA-binding protein